jgi:phenylpropionate dioxygenase-like ring-hydroxylating dioxygenase large terminal subunit
MSREQLVSIARRSLEHRAAGTQDQAAGIVQIPISNYIDRDRWSAEMDRVFRRLPLVVGASCELRQPDSYIAGEAAGTPYLVTRGDDGELRAFYNMCSHRGAIVTPEGTGTSRRHTCRYHAWSYDASGELVGVLDADDFGDIDRTCLGLTPLPCAERAGLVWIWLTDEPKIDIDTFLCGYGGVLELLGLEHCHAVGRQSLAGPNWKIAYDGYLDFYHLPILHRDSFGPGMSTKSMYDAWGPHQKVTSPDRGNEQLLDIPEADWPIEHLLGGVFTIFPHLSMAKFDAAGRLWMVSLLYPGDEPDTSTTIQLFLRTGEPDEQAIETAGRHMEFARHVVTEEDYWMGGRLQRAMRSGGKQVSLFGRNEGGGQQFHAFVDRLLETDDDELPTLFKECSRPRPHRPTAGTR